MNKKKQKIFHLITSVNLGGAENVAFTLAEHCKRNGDKSIEFFIVELYRSSTSYSNSKRVELKEKKIETLSLFKGFKHLSLIFAPITLLWFIKKEKPICIHSHTDLPDLVLANTIRLMHLFRMDIPEIIRTIHNTKLWPTYPRIAKYTESVFNNDVVVGVSKAALQAYCNIRESNNLSVSNRKMVVYNGRNLTVPSVIDISLSLSKINIAFCGRFEYQKGVDILINRMSSINRLYKNNLHFYFIGSGQFKHELDNLAKHNDNIFVHEAIPSIANKLHCFDFVIMPSRFEGLPLVSIESSFSKVPVIAAKTPGLEETLPENWPLWFDLNNEEGLLNIFEKIVNKEFDINELKQEAFDFANRLFSIDCMIEKYNKIYADLS
ncbi:glycosyltransferase family 4 protein [Flavobacterium sp. LHD-80]|uniref:glycosyltransferase family 4 protein n=1 Tax=Flavobacterium sp. LHD-80 TaxID=3071411 RepID=UPI0027E02039|nr:glycosyltransferase family 4 protein [Flavobacterium sp. LHD-80]MDQ6471029.1 glycosyltransferase family 4 protein [Flavobacterium sp. LHD-80]